MPLQVSLILDKPILGILIEIKDSEEQDTTIIQI
jgi:hypothetical protein